MSEKRQAVKSFLLSFSAAFLVLAVIATFVALMVGRNKGMVSPLPEEEIEDSYIPNEEDDLTILLAFHEYPANETTQAAYQLVHFDTKTARTLVIPLPSQTLLSQNGEKKTMDTIWKEGGSETLCLLLQESLKLPVDAYFQMDLDGLQKLISRIGTIKYDVMEEASFEREERQVSIARGKQLLDGQKIVDLGYYHLISKGEMERNDFLAEIVAQFIQKRIAPLYLENSETLYQNLLDCFNTNLSAEAYVTRGGFLKSLFQKTDRIVRVEIGGRYQENRTQFVLSDTALSTLQTMLA